MGQTAVMLLTGSVRRQSTLRADQLHCIAAGPVSCAGVGRSALCTTAPHGLVAAHALAVCQQQTAAAVRGRHACVRC